MHAQKIASLASDVAETEYRYLVHGDRRDPVVTPWMPYQPADFIGILWECMPEITSQKPVMLAGGEPKFQAPKFLDVGCGPGTKMRIAQDLFGFSVHGIEIDPEMAEEARKNFPPGRGNVTTCDALSVPSQVFGEIDLIWLYRPFRDPVSEARLEALVIAAMRPGAVLAGSSWETDPGRMGWNPVVDDCLISPDGKSQIFRGAWQKPAAGHSMVTKSGIFAE